MPRLDVLEDRLVPSTLTVTNLSDTGAAGDGSLRGQIAAASPGDTIQFAPGLRGSIALGSTLTLDRNVAVVGNVDAGGYPLVTLTRSGWYDYEAGGSTDLAVIALAEKGTMFDPGPVFYMEKMAGRDEIADLLDLDRPLGRTVELIAERRGTEVRDVMVVVLDRPRHAEGIKAIRDAGARVRLISDGDVSAAMLAVTDRSPVDLLWGVGGTPEGVISAAALKAMGGQIVGRLWPRNDEERAAALAGGYDLEKQASDEVTASGGKVVGAVRHPLGGADLSSFLLQAQASGAQVIALANAGGDTVTSIKQAAEFKIGDKQKLVALIFDLQAVPCLLIEQVGCRGCTGRLDELQFLLG